MKDSEGAKKFPYASVVQEGTTKSPYASVVQVPRGSTVNVENIEVLIEGSNSVVQIYRDVELPLEKIIYGCWRGERVCAAWSAGYGIEEPAKTHKVKVEGVATTPVSLTATTWQEDPIVLIGHKAGVRVTDANLKSLDGFEFFSDRYNAEEGQFRSALLVDKTLYAAHYSPRQGKHYPLNGIYAASFKKGQKLKKIIDRKAGPLFLFNSVPHFIHGANLNRISRKKEDLVLHEIDDDPFTSGYANGDHLVLGTNHGKGYVVDISYNHYSGQLIPYSPKVNAVGKVNYQGSSYIVAGSDLGNLVVRDFELKEKFPLGYLNFKTFDAVNCAIRHMVVPKEDSGNFFITMSNAIMEVNINSLLSGNKDKAKYGITLWQGASSSIYSVAVHQR
jgi:hypothetical protein